MTLQQEDDLVGLEEARKPLLEKSHAEQLDGDGAARPASAAVWHGVPVVQQQQPTTTTSATAAADHHDAAAFLESGVSALPSTEWQQMHGTLKTWLIVSAVTLGTMAVVGGLSALLAIVSSALGVVASVRILQPAWRGNMDQLVLAKQTQLLAGLAAGLGSLALLLMDSMLLMLAVLPCPSPSTIPRGPDSQDIEQECAVLFKLAVFGLVFFTATLGTHLFLSMRVARMAFGIMKRLNPVTAGRVALA